MRSNGSRRLRIVRSTLLGALLTGPIAGHAQRPTRPPNFVVTLADDLGYGDISP